MQTFIKAVACVIKDLEFNPKILCFEHPPPLSDLQIPKGTVEVNENIDEAVLRELYEESGILKSTIVSKISKFEIIINGGPNRDLEKELQIWHLYHIDIKNKLPDHWNHIVTGDGVDQGMVYKYFWHSLNNNNNTNFQAPFVQAFEEIRHYLNQVE